MIIVETGKNIEDANSYALLSEAESYCVKRGLWPESPQDKAEESGEENPDKDAEIDNGEISLTSEIEIEETDESTEIAEQPEEPEIIQEAIPDNAICKSKAAALFRAFDWLNTLIWKGEKLNWQQIQAWPRIGVQYGKSVDRITSEPIIVPEDSVPAQVKQAQIEMAALIYNGFYPLAPLARGGKASSTSDSISKSVDVLSKSESHAVTYTDNAPIETLYPSVIGLLRPFLAKIPGEDIGFSMIEAGRG